MNPLAGLADTMGQLAAVVRPPTVPAAAAPTPRPSRAQRRARGQRTDHRAGHQLQAARRVGELAGRRGLDHTVPGACPYNDRPLVDAWAEGYVTGNRKREATPCP